MSDPFADDPFGTPPKADPFGAPPKAAHVDPFDDDPFANLGQPETSSYDPFADLPQPDTSIVQKRPTVQNKDWEHPSYGKSFMMAISGDDQAVADFINIAGYRINEKYDTDDGRKDFYPIHFAVDLCIPRVVKLVLIGEQILSN